MGSSQSVGIEEETNNKSHPFKKLSLLEGESRDRDNDGYNELLLTIIKESQLKSIPKINSPELEEYEKFYSQSKGNTQKFFELIEERISDLYISLSKQTLELMCDKKIQSIEGKIFISQEILYTSINILKTVGMNTNFKYDSAIVNRLNGLQLSMLGYMKAKYPRQSQNFVPGELMHEFKNFDFVEQPQNDVLRHLKVSFGIHGQEKLLQQVKKFVNSLIGQIDSSYPKFEKLLSEKVFIVTKQGRQYSVENKIGRKIPENVDKMTEDEDTPIDLKSPQIFRVIVKWVNDMEDYLLNPEDQVKQKDHFKVVKLSQNELSYDYISTDQLESDLPQLKVLLQEEKQQFQNDLKGLKDHIQLFNHNLIKILTKAQRKQRYVPRREAQIIKYSMFNKKLLSWMVIQKLMIVVKKLIRASKAFQENCGIKLDLIKFNVTDLLRARMSGNKFQILKVFINLKNLENQGKIKILKIKNRLETPMNDAMLIFKMTDSFIICELQLILMDSNQSFTDKLKNIETLNHFFYELERSPYGVMAQLAALLSFKDNKTNFEQKITFQSISELNTSNCIKNHPQDVEKEDEQKKPFICSKCTQFYGEYQNIYMYHHCKICNQYQCIKCLIAQKKYEESELRTKTIAKKIQAALEQVAKKQKNHVLIHSSDNYRISQFANQPKYLQEMQKYFVSNLKVLRQLSKKKNVITFKQLQKYHKEMRDLNFAIDKIYFSICKFVGKKLLIYALKQDKFHKVSYCYDYGLTHPDRFINYGYFDFLVSNTTINTNQSTMKQLEPFSNINIYANYIVPKQDIQRKLQIHYVQINPKKQIVPICDNILILDFTHKYQKQKKEGVNQTEYSNEDYEIYNDNYYEGEYVEKKQFQYESIDELRKNQAEFVQAHQYITLNSEGITSDLLDYFQKVAWKDKIKFLNLNENKIKQVTILLKELPNLETLIISRNYIKSLNFTNKLVNFKKLVANNNRVREFKGIQNIQNVFLINLSSNFLKEFPLTQIPLPNLRQLNLKFNRLNPFKKLEQKHCPKLMHLVLSGGKERYSSYLDPPLYIELPKLKICSLNQFNLQQLHIKNATNLEQLALEDLYCKKFVLESAPNLKILSIKSCVSTREYAEGYDGGYDDHQFNEQQQKQVTPPQQIEDKGENNFFMSAILQDQFPYLTSLTLFYSWEIGVLPVLKMPQLKSLIMTGVFTTDVSNFTNSQLDNLEYFQLTGITINILPIFSLPKVKNMKFDGSVITDAKNLSFWNIPSLQQLNLSNLQPEAIIESFGNICCKNFQICGGQFKEGLAIQNHTIKKLFIKSVNCQNFPVLKLSGLQQLIIEFCTLVNFSSLQKCSFPKIKKLLATNLYMGQQQKNLPLFKYASLQEICFLSVALEDISNLSLSEFPNLTTITINDSQIKKAPSLNCPKLTSLNFSRCKINDGSGFSTSNLPNLTRLELQNNKLTEFPVLNMPNLVEISIMNNDLQSIKNLGLSELPKLKYLSLHGSNKIRQIPPKINLPQLQEFRLDMKNIKSIEGFNSFMHNNIKQLSFCDAKFENTSLPKLNFSELITLDLSNSNIQNIQSLKDSNLPKLSLLMLNNCNVKQLPVLKLSSLTKIKANNKKENKEQKKCLSSIKNLQFSQLPSLQILEFENNEISQLPKMKFPKLQNLYLSGNNIVSVEEFKKSKLPAFKLLNIYDNKITGLPISKDVRPTSLYMKDAEVKNFNQLVESAQFFQNFYYNDSVVPQNFPKCNFKRVKIFQMMRCSLTMIDDILKSSMEEVIELGFTGNQIVKVPRFDYPKLRKIYFNNNLITDIKQFTKSKLPSASMISFETNELQEFGDFPFESVEEVYLSHNRVKDIGCLSKYAFINMKMLVLWDLKIKKLCKLKAPNMVKLYLNGNQIENLNDMKGSTLHYLTLFQLSDNVITDISALNDMKLQNIQNIYLINNKLKKIPRLNLPTLILINFNQNPIENVDGFVQKKIQMLSNIYYSLNLSGPKKQQITMKLQNTYQQYKLLYQELKVSEQQG